MLACIIVLRRILIASTAFEYRRAHQGTKYEGGYEEEDRGSMITSHLH